MSFFQEDADDSNLQYDDTAFLYFVASALIIASTSVFCLIISQCQKLSIPDRKKLADQPIYHKQLKNLQDLNRRKVFNKRLVFKVILFIALVGLTYWIYLESNKGQKKMKGFDPF